MNMESTTKPTKPLAAVMSFTFPSYETASLRKLTSINFNKDDETEFVLYSATNLKPLITSICRLFGLLVSPYIILPVAPLILISSTLPVILLFIFVVALCNICVYLLAQPDSPVTNKEGYNAVGATTLPGLYHSNTAFIQSILANSPLLSSIEAKAGGLPNFIPTFWMFSGDMRTLFPFLAYKPKLVEYVRRWVRVPLADGPLDKMNHEDISHCGDDDARGLYEAVAFDCACVSSSSSSSATFSLLILAGLTGGSSEGYVLDLVNMANKQGIDCYVMLGRGLGGTVNLSDAAFHGARTSDLRECARVLRRALPASHSLFAVGISMGGIIVINAATRGDLTGLVDGAVSVSGCFDTAKNMNFPHSRGIWQPALAHGLKESFVAPSGALTKMKRRMGPHAGIIVEKVVDVIDFDTFVVTALHGYRDVYHYYNDMCGGTENRLLAMVSQDRKKSKESIDKNTTTQQGDDEEPLVPFINLDEVAKDALLANSNATGAPAGMLASQQLGYPPLLPLVSFSVLIVYSFQLTTHY